MNTAELQKKAQRAEQLRVYQTDIEDFLVMSSEGKIAYMVRFDGRHSSCTCADYTSRSKGDPTFMCKHILAVAEAVQNHEVAGADQFERLRPRLDERFITEIKGREFVLYAGLLDYAHQKGLLTLHTDILQYPTKENGYTAITRSVAKTKYGEEYSDVGDANPENCDSRIAKHLIRMSSTRSKARCLRDLTNIGMTCLEELGSLEEAALSDGKVIELKAKRTPQTKKPDAAKPEQSARHNEADHTNPVKPDKGQAEEKPQAMPKTAKGDGKDSSTDEPARPGISEAQKRAIMNLARRRGISVEELERMCREAFNCEVNYLSSSEAGAFLRQLQMSA